MAYARLRWSAQLTPPSTPTTLETQQIPVESVSQPDATNFALEAKKNSEKRSREGIRKRRSSRRKRQKATKKEAKLESRQKAILTQIREMLSKAGANIQELDDDKLHELVKKQVRNDNITKFAVKVERQQVPVENKNIEKVSEMRDDMQELVQAEKQRAESFLSLARKYYGMWKSLNDQLKSASKSGEEDSTCHVRIFSVYKKPVSNRLVTQLVRFALFSGTSSF